jgi:hypothetical protein
MDDGSPIKQPVRLADDRWWVLICSKRKVLLICFERKILLPDS